MMKDILKKLVEFPTTTGNRAATKDALDYIESFLSTRGMYTNRITSHGFESLVATTNETKTPEVMMAAHIDVVPAPAELFALHEEDGKYFGRGVVDMKFAAACYLALVDDLKDSLYLYDFGIMITSDEEAGGANGTGAVVAKGYLPKVCILPDGGYGWSIETFAKGAKYLEITTRGKTAHGSRLWLGDNAITKLMAILSEFGDKFDEPSLETNTFNVGKIYGGDAANQVPDSATALMDVRFVSKEEGERIDDLIRDICSKYDATLTSHMNINPCTNDPEDPYIKQFRDCLETSLGYRPGTMHSPAGSDARYFKQHNIPCVIVSPPGGDHHSENEWIAVEGVTRFKEVLYDYVSRVAYQHSVATQELLTAKQ